MRRLICFVLFTLVSSVYGQEKINAFTIVDSATKLVIPSVSVAIVRARISITTEKDGVFSIPGDLQAMSDTVILSAQNYFSSRLSINSLHDLDTIYLKKLEKIGGLVNIEYSKDSLLNDFDRKNIAHYAGLHTETAMFEQLQLAQQFNISQEGLLLKGVTVYRLAFVLDYFDRGQRELVGVESTKFRIRIYDVDSLTGGPGRDLCEKIIELRDKDSRQLRVNLSEHKIVIPNKTFFVAVEWLRDYYNMGYTMVLDKKLHKEVQQVNYRPAIGVSPLKGDKLNIWGLNIKNEWKPYTYFSPDYTDLAIKARIAY